MFYYNPIVRALRLARMYLEEPELYLFLSKCEPKHKYILEFRKSWCSLRDRFRKSRYDKQMGKFESCYEALGISPLHGDS